MWWEHVKGCRCCNRKGHMYACGLSFACLFAAILQYPMHTFAWICRDEMTEKEPGKKAVLFTTGGKQKSASSGIHQVLRCGKQKGWLNFLDFPHLLNFLVRTISAYRCSLTIYIQYIHMVIWYINDHGDMMMWYDDRIITIMVYIYMHVCTYIHTNDDGEMMAV